MGFFDSRRGRHAGGMSPVQMGVLGLLAYKAFKGKGGLSGILGSGQAHDSSGNAMRTGAAGGGLRDLLDRFRDSGHGDKAQSWVSKEQNQSIAPHEMEQTLGEERIQWLMEQTGLPRDELLAGLSNELPGAIDQLTPDGRVPTDEEFSRRPS